MTPILRSENGSPGAYSLFYDEVDDIVAAAEALAQLPRGDPTDVPFDQTNPEEYRMRSAIQFPGSFKCPVRIYYGAEEQGTEGFVELAQRARAAGRDVEAVRVAGDHDTMKAAALPLVIELFRGR